MVGKPIFHWPKSLELRPEHQGREPETHRSGSQDGSGVIKLTWRILGERLVWIKL